MQHRVSTLKLLLLYLLLLACLATIATGAARKPTGGSLGSVTSNRFPTSDEDDEDDPFEDDARVYKNPRNSPSALCPRDEEQAELLGQKCLRKCSSDEDCKSKKKKCLCDGACGMSCIKPDRECDEVAAPALGRVRLTGRLFGDRAIYSCEEGTGTRLVGLSERVCQADGQWAGSPPVCNKDVFCGEAPRIEHARHTALPAQRSFPVDTTLQYQCQPGYATTGFPHAKCLALDGSASWYGPDITCEPRSCGPPLGVEHGWTEGDCHTFNCHVLYHCAVGFELSGGRNERICTADGSWMPRELPTCVPVQCPIPENPLNGKAIYTSCAYNSVVSYECKYGYRLLGEPSRRCGPDKQWTGDAPVCKEVPACRTEDSTGARCTPGTPGCSYANCQQEVNCGHPGMLYNGWLEGIEGGTMLGASIIFRCQEGMTMVGNASTVCQLDGTWRYPLPKCLAPCVLPNVPRGKLKDNSTTGPVVPHGYRLEMECQASYEFAPHAAHVLCNNGTWTHVARCEPARCKHLPKAPRNGMVIAPKTDHNKRARFSCKDGYTLRGPSTSVCAFGSWTGEMPYCQEVYCPFPGYIENGKVMLVGNMGLYDYRPYVRKVTNNKQIMYDCDRGYVLADGPVGATCVGGRWSPKDLPRCVPGQHPRLRWSREVHEKKADEDPKMTTLIARWEALQRSKRSVFLSGMLPRLTSRAKRDTADWDYPSYPAQPQEEDEPANWMDRMQAAQAHSKTVATKVGTLDKKGKGKNKNRGKSGGNRGNRNRNKDVDETAAFCEPIREAPYINVTVVKPVGENVSSNALGSVVRIECTQGYSPTLFNRTGRCVRGAWKPRTPDCVIMNCEVPPIESGRYTLHGHVVNTNDTVKTYHTIELGCNRGYNMHGPTSLYCLHGEWTASDFPSCEPAPCRLPAIRNGQFLKGYRAGLTIAHGATVNYQCEPEYSRNPNKPVECLHGELRPNPPSCRLKGGANIYATQRPEIGVDGASILLGGSNYKGVTPSVTSTRGRACGPPERVQGSLVYRDGAPLADGDRSFPHNTEITFDCIASIMGEKTTWKITCEDGTWLGHSLSCVTTEDYGELDFPHNMSCTFRNTEPNLIYFFNDQPITEEMVEFPPGTELEARCTDIGKYSMIGSNRRVCQGGEWDGHKPVCFGLNQENDYALEKPPTILFRHQLGPIAQSNDGKLIVSPGTILHMECLWIRRFGTPKWNVSHSYRKYPEGWVTDPARDSQLEYRLSIMHATGDDSGTFTCITPTRHTHSVDIFVKLVHCPMLTPRRGMTLSTKITKMNTRVTFTCQNGEMLIGTEEIVCLPSGNWSAPVPVCEAVECPDSLDVTEESHPNLRVTIQSQEAGGRAIFTCAPGYGLRGPSESICQSDGRWSDPIPICHDVKCEHPGPIENGMIQGDPTNDHVYKSGDMIQIICKQEYKLEGTPILACQETGRWSSQVPKCVKACSYPGTTINGRIETVKFYYQLGETVKFSCDPGHELRGPEMLECVSRKNRLMWSSAIPTCVPLTKNITRAQG